MTVMYCGECGMQMTRRPDGAWNGCCKNLGYWSDVVPLIRDLQLLGYPGAGAWLHMHPSDNSPPLFFYPTARWPAKRMPAFPPQSIFHE